MVRAGHGAHTMPDSAMLSPALNCCRRLSKSDVVSPDLRQWNTVSLPTGHTSVHISATHRPRGMAQSRRTHHTAMPYR